MNKGEKSDSSIVPEKRSNKETGKPAFAENVEGRGLAKRNPDRQTRDRTQRRAALSHALERIRQAAKKDKDIRFTALWHHMIGVDRLRDAFGELKKTAAPGADGVTWKRYEGNLEENLKDLSERLRKGAYQAQPVKRVYIPKADGRQRPIGVTTLEDKVVQRAVTQVLEAIYEVDFLGFSYGFRPGRNAHEALDALAVGIRMRKVSWILDADIRGFFDTIDHEWLIRFIQHRIGDKRVIRQIKKWLKAGVLEIGTVKIMEAGTPQGGSISPLLANIYLHYSFDLWIQTWRRKQARGDVIVVRYADDFVLGFQHRGDAERCLDNLYQRLNRFHLTMHEGKTRLIEFGRFAPERCKEKGRKKPDTFDFLGFTHICAQNRKGKFIVLRKTTRQRLRSKVKALKKEMRRRMHFSIESVGRWLARVLQGHYQYFGVPRNIRALQIFYHDVIRVWLKSLKRRSHKHRMTWERMSRIVKRWLPSPRITQPYPEERLGVTTQGRSLVR